MTDLTQAPTTPGLTGLQYRMLAARLNPDYVQYRDSGDPDEDPYPYVPVAHIKRTLIRIFGYGGWSQKSLNQIVIASEPCTLEQGDGSKDGWSVTREVTVRLTVPSPTGVGVTEYDGTAVRTVQHTGLGEAHNNATNAAESLALKRAAKNLGDAFGLGLDAGYLAASYVGGSLIRPAGVELAAQTADAAPEVDQLNAPDPEPDVHPTVDEAAPTGWRKVAAAIRLPADVNATTEALRATIARAKAAQAVEAATP